MSWRKDVFCITVSENSAHGHMSPELGLRTLCQEKTFELNDRKEDKHETSKVPETQCPRQLDLSDLFLQRQTSFLNSPTYCLQDGLSFNQRIPGDDSYSNQSKNQVDQGCYTQTNSAVIGFRTRCRRRIEVTDILVQNWRVYLVGFISIKQKILNPLVDKHIVLQTARKVKNCDKGKKIRELNINGKDSDKMNSSRCVGLSFMRLGHTDTGRASGWRTSLRRGHS